MIYSDSTIREAVKEVCHDFFGSKKLNEALFVQRMYSGGLGRYIKRLEKINFQNCKRIFDAGCGYGQWTLALSLMNESVVACDIDANRITFLRKLMILLGIKNIKLDLNGVDERKYRRNYFDAIFCYSVLNKTDWKKSLDNIVHSLKPGGCIYICANGLGWYIYNYESNHNAVPDYSPRQYAIGSIQKTISSHFNKRDDLYSKYDYIISSDEVVEALLKKCTIIYKGNEGGAILNTCCDGNLSESFFIGQFRGVEAVYEIVSKKLLGV